MKIEKTNNTIISIRKTEDTDFTLTNNKGETREITVREFYSDSEYEGYESEETIMDKSGEEINNFDEWLLEFMGCPVDSDNEPEADPDDLIDEIRELCNN
jgi:hypothetical protein